MLPGDKTINSCPITLCIFLRRKVTPVIRVSVFTPRIEERRVIPSQCMSPRLSCLLTCAGELTTTASSSRLLIILRARVRDSFLSGFLRAWEPLSPRLNRARTHSGHNPARVGRAGSFPFVILNSWQILWSESRNSTCWAANYHLRALTFNIFICYFLSNRLAGGCAVRAAQQCSD